MEIRLIKYGSPEYHEMIHLRMEILRKPLGLSFTKEQLDAEKTDSFVAAFDKDTLVGCCVLTPVGKNMIQLRQMAVQDDYRSKGLGKRMLEFAEEYARKSGYATLMMHARKVALEFYRKCGYHIVGGEFIEVTIPHHHMEKDLRN